VKFKTVTVEVVR